MQADVREQIAGIVDADLGNTAAGTTLDDFGFNNPPHVVIRCFQALRNFGILPEPGGLLDQDQQLWDDIMTMFAVYNDVKRQIDPPAEAPAGDIYTDMW